MKKHNQEPRSCAEGDGCKALPSAQLPEVRKTSKERALPQITQTFFSCVSLSGRDFPHSVSSCRAGGFCERKVRVCKRKGWRLQHLL